MKEIAANEAAWGLLSQEHYRYFKQQLQAGTHRLNPHIERELGDITGLRVAHLQCNTGADSILLAQQGAAQVTGIDLVPANIDFA